MGSRMCDVSVLGAWNYVAGNLLIPPLEGKGHDELPWLPCCLLSLLFCFSI